MTADERKAYEQLKLAIEEWSYDYLLVRDPDKLGEDAAEMIFNELLMVDVDDD